VEKPRSLAEKAEGGDKVAVIGLRKVLDDSPSLAWRFIEEPGKLAEEAFIDEFTRDEHLASKEVLKHQLESMRIELAGENPSPLERLLVERVVATWLQVQLFDTSYAFGMKSGTIIQDEFRQKRLDRAHRRHPSAVRTLAQIRKMGPAIQINTAEKQINAVN
jgi:hypothetical protein